MKLFSDELPSLHFAKSRMIADCILESIELSVSAKSSRGCLCQFKKVLQALEDANKKEEVQHNEIKNKKIN